jgi:spermidine synthase
MTTRILFVFFLVSGFASLVYEVVWLRLGMAQFGVTTGVVSIILSVFMGGLALGSWLAGRLAARLEPRPTSLLLRLYAGAELIVAVSRDVVPAGLVRGRTSLEHLGSGAWGSPGYNLASGLWIAVTLLPFCVCMGATFPLAMGAIRKAGGDWSRSFSLLYAANVAGATVGTLVSAFIMIEALGFRGTLALTATLNAVLAAGALALSLLPTRTAGTPVDASLSRGATPPADGLVGTRALWALFSTGFVSMAMEVVWVRQLTPYLGNVVYAFALILALYLVANTSSSFFYRWRAGRGGASVGPAFWGVMAAASLLPLAAADPRWGLGGGTSHGPARAALGIVPFCALLGYATPLLVDRWSGGDPARAGSAYAINVLGCILGPLAAGFGILPYLGEGGALLALALPLFALGAAALGPSSGGIRERPRPLLAMAAMGVVALGLFAFARSYESRFEGAVVLRDAAATVVAAGQRSEEKRLLVNGIGMTYLTPITKMMIHLPLALQGAPPRSALIICFGMGTTFRSSLSWNIETTVVELIPSVPRMFWFFHPDGPRLLQSPKATVVIDDGRRFLERSRDVYDAIVIDPPPPLSAAGSSLLYSREFYETASKRLRPNGILQQWIPGGDPYAIASLARAFQESFPFARAFVSVSEGWGAHLLGSHQPIPGASASTLADRLPPAAARDIVEWGPASSPEGQFKDVLDHELPLDWLRASAPMAPALHDDRPINEYFVLRSLQAGLPAK